MNYFSLFKLPIRYQIDIKQLTSLFQELQRRYHPDRFINSTKEKKLIAIQQSTVINQAWKTLYDPIMRAEYLLSLHGFDLSQERSIIYNRVFLMKQLEMCEKLENLEKEKNKLQLEIFIKYLKEKCDIWYFQMIEQLNNEKWDMAANILCKLRFLKKLHSNAEKIEEKLEEELLDF